MTLGAALVIAAFFALGGKPYYAAPAWCWLTCVGAVAAERALSTTWRKAFATVVLCVAGATAIAFTLPLQRALPFLDTAIHKSINADLAQFPNWRGLVAHLADAARAATPSPSRPPTVLTDSYGLAAALERYGPAHGLPEVRSGANGYHLWHAEAAAPAVVLAHGYGGPLLRELFHEVRELPPLDLGGTADNRFDFPRPLHLCSRLRVPWSQAWPKLRRYD